MDISLPNYMENILKTKVSEGIFETMEDAITFAIKFAFIDNNISQEHIDALNAEIEKGWQDMENGNFRDSEVVFKELRSRYAS